MVLLLAVIAGLIGVIPLLRRPVSALGVGIVYAILTIPTIYSLCPSLAEPLFGGFGIYVLILWFGAAILDSMEADEPTRAFFVPIGGLVIFMIVWLTSWEAWRSSDYKGLIGPVETRQWTQDVQPKNPEHVRLVTKELAFYLATKQLGGASGSVGSQFQINPDLMTLQIVNGELWYVAPLDFKSYSSWTSTEGSPGYVMVHGEDPKRPVITKTGLKIRYLKSAFFGDEIERFAWKKYGTKYVLTDFTFELDDSGKPYWTVTASHPTIGWSGSKVDGVIVIDPVSGEHSFYELGKIPKWIDRVMPQDFVKSYISLYGLYVHGWWNAYWANQDIFEPEEPSIAYGSDGEPYWVTGIASAKGSSDHNQHSSLIGLIYTDARTGKSILYRASGGTEEATTDLVNNKVSYKNLHGAQSQIYNIYGVMTAIVPLLGKSHSFQGVALVDIANMQVADGNDIESALRQYQRVLSTSGQEVAPEKVHDLKQLSGIVSRFIAETRGGETMYYLYLANFPHIFAGSADISSKLRLAKAGDQVQVGFIDSKEDVVPIESFDDRSFVVTSTSSQTNLQSAVSARQEQVRQTRDANDARVALENMSDQQILNLLKQQKKQ